MRHLLQLDGAGICFFFFKITTSENTLILRAEHLPKLMLGMAKGLRSAQNAGIHGVLQPCCPGLSQLGLGQLKGAPRPAPPRSQSLQSLYLRSGGGDQHASHQTIPLVHSLRATGSFRADSVGDITYLEKSCKAKGLIKTSLQNQLNPLPGEEVLLVLSR